MTRFSLLNLFSPVNGSCLYSNGSVLPNQILYATGYLNISVVCMPLEVNRCIPLDLFMVLFIGLVFRNDVYS